MEDSRHPKREEEEEEEEYEEEEELHDSGGRTPTSASRRSGKWTVEQDEALRSAVEFHEGKSWRLIAQTAGTGHSPVQCLQRWNKVLRPGLLKGPWTSEEDARLANGVALAERPNDWVTVAKHVPGRTAKQCRERWSLCLDPSIHRGDWTEAEDEAILRAYEIHGRKWAVIARIPELMGKRTVNGVKSRIMCIEKKRRKMWTEEEDEALRRMKQNGRHWSDASTHEFPNRSRHAIKKRWAFLFKNSGAMRVAGGMTRGESVVSTTSSMGSMESSSSSSSSAFSSSSASVSGGGGTEGTEHAVAPKMMVTTQEKVKRGRKKGSLNKTTILKQGGQLPSSSSDVPGSGSSSTSSSSTSSSSGVAGDESTIVSPSSVEQHFTPSDSSSSSSARGNAIKSSSSTTTTYSAIVTPDKKRGKRQRRDSSGGGGVKHTSPIVVATTSSTSYNPPLSFNIPDVDLANEIEHILASPTDAEGSPSGFNRSMGGGLGGMCHHDAPQHAPGRDEWMESL